MNAMQKTNEKKMRRKGLRIFSAFAISYITTFAVGIVVPAIILKIIANVKERNTAKENHKIILSDLPAAINRWFELIIEKLKENA